MIGQLAIVRLAIGPSTTVGQAIAHGARRFPAALGALLIIIAALFVLLIPVGAALTKASRTTRYAVLVTMAGLSAWYGGYLLLVWTRSP